MSVDSIIIQINEKSRKEEKTFRKKEIERAHNVRKNIIDNSLKQANSIIKKAKEEAKEIEKKEKLIANLTARKNTLAKKQELIDEAFDRSLKKLKQLDGVKWAVLTKHIIKEQHLSGTYTLLVPKEDKEKYNRYFSLVKKEGREYIADLSNELTKETGERHDIYLSKEDGTFAGGCMILTEKYDIDLTFETLLQEVREQYERDVYTMLFESGEGNA